MCYGIENEVVMQSERRHAVSNFSSAAVRQGPEVSGFDLAEQDPDVGQSRESLWRLRCPLRPAEALTLEWRDVHLDEQRSGYLQVRGGKTRYRARSLNLTSRVRLVLEKRRQESRSNFLFGGDPGRPYL